MKLLRKQMLLCSILFLVFTLSACSAIGQTDENNLTDSATSAEKTVSVVRGTITPTVSTQTTIVPAVPFIIFSPEMLVGIIAMLGSVLVGTLGREYLISVNAQVYGWSPTYSFVITESDFHDRNKMEQLFQRFEAIDDVAAVTFSMGEDIRFAPMKDLTPIPPNDVYQNLMAFDLVCTTEAYSQVYNLPMTSGRWLEPSSEGGSLEVVINKEAKNYFNDSPYAAGNVKSTLSLTPFNIVGVVNDGRDFPTIYADSAAILNFAPAMWQVQNANVYWHPTTGLTIEQIHSALGDILTDTIGGYWESAGRSDIGDTYDSVLSILQLGLLVTSLLLLFVSVLGRSISDYLHWNSAHMSC
mgnify:FL=1